MDFPFSVKPDKKISVQDVMDMTRDRSQGTPFDRVKGLRGGPFRNPNYLRHDPDDRQPRASSTRPSPNAAAGLPAPIGGIVWI